MYKLPNVNIKIYKTKTLAASIAEITNKFIEKNGNDILQKLHINWPLIVGQEFSNITSATKIQFPHGKKTSGTLWIQTKNPALSLVLSAMQNKIISRIHNFFGAQVISHIKINVHLDSIHKQQVANQNNQITLDIGTANRLATMVDSIQDEAFKNTMAKFIKAFTKT